MAYERVAQELIDEFGSYEHAFDASLVVETLREAGEDMVADLVEGMDDRIKELETRLSNQRVKKKRK